MEKIRGCDRPFFKSQVNKPEVIAHRGGADEWPGETIYAFDQALKIGADVLEMDVHSTKSDDHNKSELVLMHNNSVEATTNGYGKIKDLFWNQIKQLDAGYWFTRNDGNTFPCYGKGIKVPTLEAVFVKFPNTRMVIEIKQHTPSIVEPLIDLIRHHQMVDKVLIASFYHRSLVEFREKCPEVATSASTLELAKFIFFDSLFSSKNKVPAFDALQVGIRFAGIPIRLLNWWTMRAARKMNLPIHPWTVNRSDDMQKMIDAEVDGIITDDPTILLNLLKRYKAPPPNQNIC